MRRTTLGLAMTLLHIPALALAQWEPQASGTTARFRGLSVVNAEVAWASGTKGTVVATKDGGKTWALRPVAGAEALDLRDIQAFDDRRAVALSIGEGEMSRVYRTADGGATWELAYTNPDAKGFLDAIAFWDADHGLALGDPVDGRFVVLTTDDGGKTWARIAADGMPPALKGEGAFAASGTCLVVGADGLAWFGTGGAEVARVFRSADRGRTWAAHPTPLRAGAAAAGVFSLAFRDGRRGLAVGGDYQKADDAEKVLATTEDGGKTWAPAGAGAGGPSGYRSAVAFGPGGMALAVGPSGSDLSGDDGRTWKRLDGPGFHAAALDPRTGLGWAVGDDGRIARFAPRPASPR